MLQKDTVSIPLGVGIDTKTDSKLVASNKLLNLENARVGDAKITKRFGYNELGTKVYSNIGTEPTTTTLTKGQAVGAFNNQLMLFNDSSLYTYSPAQDVFIDKGKVIGADVKRIDVKATDSNLVWGDSAYFQNLYCFAYVDTTTTELLVSIKDRENGTTILDGAVVNSAISSPAISHVRVLYNAGKFWIFYEDAADLKFQTIDLQDLQTISSATTVDSSSSPRFDVCVVDNNNFGIVFSDNANTDVQLGIWNVSAASFTDVTISEDAQSCVGICYEPNDAYLYVFLGLQASATSNPVINYYVYDLTLNEISTTSTLISTAYFSPNRIACAPLSDGTVVVYYWFSYGMAHFSNGQVDASNDLIDLGNGALQRFVLGQEVLFSAPSGAPTGLSSGSNYFIIPVSGGYKLASTRANALANSAINITSAGTGNMILQNDDDDIANNGEVFKAVVDNAGNVTNFSSRLNNVTLASKPLVIDDLSYFVVDTHTDLQATSYLIIDDPFGPTGSDALPFSAISKCNYNIGLTAQPNSLLKSLNQISDNEMEAINAYRISASSVNGEFTYQTAINAHEFNISTSKRYFNDQLGKNTIIAGGIVKAYDGNVVTELNFNYFPEIVRAGFQTTGGSLAAGTYGLIFIYEWTDSQGLVHKSAPSVSVSVMTTGSTSTIRASIPQLRLTEKQNVSLVTYMTTLNGSIYYRRSTETIAPVSPTGSRISQVVEITSAPAGTEEILYTTGGILENIAPPPSQIITASKNRVFLVNSENRKEFWYSKKQGLNEGISFNGVLSDKIDQSTTDIEIAQAMDDKILFLKKNEIHFISGDGPNNLGINNTFTSPQLITNQIGSTNPDSIVFMKDGVMFQSVNKGIWMCSRGLDILYIGADVEGYKDERITSANNLNTVNEIRFTTESGTQLVYDYFKQQWNVDTNIPATDAISIEDSYYYVRPSNGIVFKESSSYLDASKDIRMKVGTPWIKLKNIQGFQRVRRMILLGTFKSSHKLKIKIAYDYEEFFRDTLTWDAGDVLDVSTFGDDTLFGDDSVFGGVSDGVYQVRLHLPRQKCQAIRFQFEDISEENSGENLEITGIDLEVGLKSGVNKLRADKSI